MSNYRRIISGILIGLLFSVLTPPCLLLAQAEEEPAATGEASGEAGEAEEEPVPEVKIQPRFPEQNPKLIFVEGEEAVSTNFNKEPILNYGCSGRRTLQLSRNKGLQGGAAFYADFVFYVEEPGTYEFWYGGTPPGPADELYPSFVSPFTYVLDNAAGNTAVYREDVTVVENYTPSYYWNRVTELEFQPGKHQIRFEVDQKRGHDSRFYFYLDCFFFVKVENSTRVTGSILPKLFPGNMDDTSINYPFRSLDDYLIVIRDYPDRVDAYMEISMIYSLLSDYLNAIKYLKRATILDAENPDYLLLLAKNYIWKGDVSQGLELYNQLLDKDPSRKDIWLEAGKVAGWTGRYDDSVAFFKSGLNFFPGDLDLKVNLALTYLWSGERKLAEEELQQAYLAAGSDLKALKELALVFEINGYPDKAADAYRAGMKLVPEDIELYLLLEDLYFNSGRKDQSLKIRERIVKTFLPSETLDKYLALFYERMTLKEQVIGDYAVRLQAEPDNLELREMLAQAYFWNGLKGEAIDEYLNILSNHAYRQLQEMEEANFPLLETLDRFYIYLDYFSKVTFVLNEKKRLLGLQSAKYGNAVKTYEAHLAKVKKAGETGKTVPPPEVDPLVARDEAADGLASLLADTEELAFQYESMYNSLLVDIETVNNLSDKNDRDQEVFGKIIELIDWKWDQNLLLREQQQIAGRGLTLANHVLAKVYQVDKKFPEALANYQKIMDQLSYPELEYGYFQLLLWSGDQAGAFTYYNRPESQIDAYAAYLGELRFLADSYAVEITGTPGVLAEDTTAATQAALEQLVTSAAGSLSRKKEVETALTTLHRILSNTMVRTFYHYQESTYLLRNELGDSLLIAERLPEAIDQYKQVLAIDPWDVSAVYRLGTVYQWNKDWYKAMDYFKRVYNVDPNYENATALYNRLAREHSDILGFDAMYSADGQSVNWSGEASYRAELNGTAGLEFAYRTENTNLYRWPPTMSVPPLRWHYEDADGNPVDNVNNYAYQIHGLSFGLPLTVPALSFSLTPCVGSVLVLGDEFLVDVADQFAGYTGAVLPGDFFGYNLLLPYVKAAFIIGEHPYFLLSGEVRYGTYEPTYGYARRKNKAVTGFVNLATDFVYTEVPFIKNFRLRAYGEWEYILDLDLRDFDTAYDSNTIYAVTGELAFKVFEIAEPYLTLNLFGNFTYQDSTLPADELVATDWGEVNINSLISYYSPHQVLTGGGGLILNSNLGVTEQTSLGLNLRLSGDYNQSYNVWALDETQVVQKYLKLMAAGGVDFTRGNGTVSIGSSFYNQQNRDSKAWDSWYFALNLGFTSRLPALLAR